MASLLLKFRDHRLLRGGLALTLILFTCGFSSASTELISNGGFENSFTNWGGLPSTPYPVPNTASHSALYSISTDSHSGSKSLYKQQSYSYGDMGYMLNTFTLSQASRVNFSFWYKDTAGSGNYFIVSLVDGNGQNVLRYNNIGNGQNVWTFVSGITSQLSPGTYGVYIQNYKTYQYWLDDISVNALDITVPDPIVPISYVYYNNPAQDPSVYGGRNGLYFSWDRAGLVNTSNGELFLNADAYETCDEGHVTYGLNAGGVGNFSMNSISGEHFDYFQGSSNYTIALRMHYTGNKTEIVGVATYNMSNNTMPAGDGYSSTIPYLYNDNGVHPSGSSSNDKITTDSGNTSDAGSNNNTSPLPSYPELNNPNYSGNLSNNSTYPVNQSGGASVNNSVFLGYYQLVDNSINAFNNPVQGVLYFCTNPLYDLSSSINTTANIMSGTFQNESGYTGFLYVVVHPVIASIPSKVQMFFAYELLLVLVLLVLRG